MEDDRGTPYGEQQGYTARGQRTSVSGLSINMMVEDVPRDLKYVTLRYLPGTKLDLRVELKEVGA